MVDVTRELNGLRKAAAEFFLEGYEYPEANRMLEQTRPEHRAAARKKLFTPRTLPDGYYTWIFYLIWLERILEVTQFSLHAVEVEGLALLKQERNKFQASHPPCPHCGMPNEAHALRCRECMGEIGK